MPSYEEFMGKRGASAVDNITTSMNKRAASINPPPPKSSDNSILTRMLYALLGKYCDLILNAGEAKKVTNLKLITFDDNHILFEGNFDGGLELGIFRPVVIARAHVVIIMEHTNMAFIEKTIRRYNTSD